MSDDDRSEIQRIKPVYVPRSKNPVPLEMQYKSPDEKSEEQGWKELRIIGLVVAFLVMVFALIQVVGALR